jgi:Cysteine rich repeat
MRRMMLVLAFGAAAVTPIGTALSQSKLDILTAGCADDAKQLCAGVPSGGGQILACLKQHKDQLSAQCKQAAAHVSAQSTAAPPNSTHASPTSSFAAHPPAPDAADAILAAPSARALAGNKGSTAASKPPSTTPAPAAAKGVPATAGSYLLMKQVKVIDPGMDKVQAALPAYDLLIPSDWQFMGNVVFGGARGGCFADTFALVITATSADGSTKFQVAPDFTWQYADDPNVMKSLTDPNRRALGSSAKSCQVAKPMKAEDYFRRNVLTLFPSGASVVSVESFPELNEIVRKRQGLAPGDANTGHTRTEAIRARLAFQKDGKDLEEWVGLVVVTKISPVGRGSFYDSHAMSLVALTAPKGSLDANDKLFKLIVSSIQPEPKWMTYSNGVLSRLYQAEAQKNAVIDKIYAQLQNLAIQDIQEVTANQLHGSTVSVMQTDQNIRKVQTYRDPSTGRTMELSNLYNYAWYNSSSNQYVMSDDPNFKASALSGSWSALQAVSPSP